MVNSHSQGMSSGMKAGFAFVSIGSFLISLLFTLQFLSGQATTPYDSWLFSGMGIVTETAKVLFFAVGMYLILKAKSALGYVVIIIAVCFMIMSVLATVMALSNGYAAKKKAETLSSDGYQSIQNQISGFDTQAQALRSQAESLPSNYHIRKNELLTQATDLESQKSALAQQLGSYSGSNNTTVSSAGYRFVASFLNTTEESVAFNTGVIYGCLLELVSAFSALFSAFGDRIVTPKKRKRNESNDDADFDESDQSDQDFRRYEPQADHSRNGNGRGGYADDSEDRGVNRRFDTADRTLYDGTSYETSGGARQNLANLEADYIRLAWSLRTAKQIERGELAGRRKILDELRASGYQIDRRDVDRIHANLKKRGLITSQDNATIPKKSQAEMLSNLSHVNAGKGYGQDIAKNILTVFLMVLAVPTMGFCDTGSSGESPLTLLFLGLPALLVGLFLLPKLMSADQPSQRSQAQFRQHTRRGVGLSGFLVIVLVFVILGGFWAFIPRNSAGCSNYEYYILGARSMQDLQKIRVD